MQNKIKKIGVMTSGGDAPGMNAAIRAIVRTAISNDIEVLGFMRGYEGVLNKDYIKFDSTTVSDIINKGGTMLLSARSKKMMTPEGQEEAYQNCKELGLDALIVIGGDGSLTGAKILAEKGLTVMGIPGTIDLDLPCSDYTIGFDTSVNTALEAINKIKDTSFSHERCSIIEVMGRNAGYIALWTGLASGAEEVLIPENPTLDEQDVINVIKSNKEKGKVKNVIIVAEGYTKVDSRTLAQNVEKATGIETRATILGHLQRGGSPTALDIMYASVMGKNAVEHLIKGDKNLIMIYKDGKHTSIDLVEGLKVKREYESSLYDLIKTLTV